MTIREQLEALNASRPPAVDCTRVHAERRARILVVLKTPRETREIARLLAITIATAREYMSELKDEGLVTEDGTRWRLL